MERWDWRKGNDLVTLFMECTFYRWVRWEVYAIVVVRRWKWDDDDGIC